MPRKSTPVVAEPQACPACDGTGQTPQPITRRRGTVHGQMGVCLTCLGTGTAPTRGQR
jgi:DnaJ-class molecular chaperone